tara:strand:+ start:95 stop:574 length:480 start_codon:yes stop_codon:yes gene_type:complete
MSKVGCQNHTLRRNLTVHKPISEVFAFFSNASNLEAITPPFLHFRILTKSPIQMELEGRIDYALSLFGVPIRWRTRISCWEPNIRFIDEQESGPFAFWRHTHEFISCGDDCTVVSDLVEYREPLGVLGMIAHKVFVAKVLAKIFDYRRDQTIAFLEPQN